jgi:DNA-binding transcriptional ArsR family regulator
MSTQKEILEYCIKPKTSVELAEHFGLSKATIYTHLHTLQRSGKIEKRGDDKRKAAPAIFITIRQAPKPTPSNGEYENLAITRAHNPFGLKYEGN